ncbi:MAG: tRNA pseudouridine(55) synthase TruB [Ktedonobacterales bacterium]|nr:tRNA pseudouridine(55) synthase TruB [Ktedonobacterales bacterium]
MDGIFNINKATGMTSHDVVAHVRRLAHQKRVGHAGTLDPAAGGVLPVCLGQATRVAEYLSERGKAYRATIRFGVVTDTYDAEGTTLREAPVCLTHEHIAATLPDFLGEQMQVPPIYSAIKRGGRPLYALARAGEAVTPEPRLVRIDALSIVDWQAPDLVLDVECGKGTYIRSLAYDLGERLGPGAHLAALTRTRSGSFTLAESLTLEALARALESGAWRDHLYAPDEALLGWHAAILGTESEVRMRTGQLLSFAADPTADEATPLAGARAGGEPLLRAYSADGRFLGILRWHAAGGAWQPHKVLEVAPVEE